MKRPLLERSKFKNRLLKTALLLVISCFHFQSVLGSEVVGLQQNGATVSGVVLDGNSTEPLIGVTVIVEGTTNGTVTDRTEPLA